jgi:catechol 2,3-dioxygenase-like lactoylglutathione lyase family enzyme
MKILKIDHLVLTVKDIDKTCEFYNQVLGMEVITFGEGRKALHFGEQKINLHEVAKDLNQKQNLLWLVLPIYVLSQMFLC